MPFYNYLRLSLKRRDVLVLFFFLSCTIAYLSWQFGLADLANQKAPSLAEQYKIIYPYIAGLIALIIPFLINAYIDDQVRQEVEKAKSDLEQRIRTEETSEGIRAKQELVFVASYAQENEVRSIDSLINLNALLPVVQKEILKPNSRNYLSLLSKQEAARDLAVISLLKKNEKGHEFALILARTAVYKEFNISKEKAQDDPEFAFYNTLCKELYICLRAWLVCSLKQGWYMPVKALRITYPDKKNRYKSALKRIYQDILDKKTADAYLPSELDTAQAVKEVITTYLKWLSNNL